MIINHCLHSHFIHYFCFKMFSSYLFTYFSEQDAKSLIDLILNIHNTYFMDINNHTIKKKQISSGFSDMFKISWRLEEVKCDRG